MVGSQLLSKSSMPRSNRQYVPPGLLSRGRGMNSRMMNTLGGQTNINSYIGVASVGKDSSLKRSTGTNKSQIDSMSSPQRLEDDDDHFDPLFPSSALFVYDGADGQRGMVYDEPVCENLNDNEDVRFSPEEEEDDDMHSLPPRDMTLEREEEREESQNQRVEPHQSNNQSVDDGTISRKRNLGSTKRRGRNKCKQIAKLKPGEKLPITFFNNRAVGENHNIFSRHLGRIVRDSNICSVKVHKWRDFGERERGHMWTAVTDVFHNDDMEAYREHIFSHMNELWNNWRSDLFRKNITKKNLTLKAALRHVPNGLAKEDWAWLIKEHYSSDKFKEASEKNSRNRAKYADELLHRTGSMPLRQLMWEDLGVKKGQQPTLRDIYAASRKKGDKLVNDETTKKCDEIQESIQNDPTLSHAQIAEKVFKSKSRDRIVGYGGGVKLKDIRASGPTRVDLQVELNASKKENEILQNRLKTMEAENQQFKSRQDTFESQLKMFQDLLLRQNSTSAPSPPR